MSNGKLFTSTVYKTGLNNIQNNKWHTDPEKKQNVLEPSFKFWKECNYFDDQFYTVPVSSSKNIMPTYMCVETKQQYLLRLIIKDYCTLEQRI